MEHVFQKYIILESMTSVARTTCNDNKINILTFICRFSSKEYSTTSSCNCRCCYFQTPSVVHFMNATASAQSPNCLRNFYPQTILPTSAGNAQAQLHFCGNAQAQLHFQDNQQRAFGISNISSCRKMILSRKEIWQQNQRGHEFNSRAELSERQDISRKLSFNQI